MRPRRSKGRSDRFVRYLAWLCLFLTLWPAFSTAADAPPPATVPVVTNISGAVIVRSAGGVSRDVINSRIIHAGDTLVTGVDSLAVLSLADVGTVRLGPGSTASASATSSSLSVNLAVGSLCAQSQTRAVTLHAGGLLIAAGDDSAIFSLIRDQNETTLAVYQGQVSAAIGKSSTVFHAGEAAVSSHGGNPTAVPIQSIQPQLAALKCPDAEIVARAVPSPEPSAASHGGGGGGGFLGILLGLGAVAALAGHGGGGGGGGGSPPTPPPGPGQLSVNPSSLSFLVGAAAQSFTASESNYTGAINASSGNAAVATVTPAAGTGPGPVTFTVTPIGAGTTSITVTDNHGGSQIVSVTVSPPGILSVNPTSLSFLVGGASQPFTASESAYTGLITASSDDIAVATVTPGSGTGPGPVTFTVTPTGAGTTSITVKDDHGGQKKVSITVAPPGSLTVRPGSLTFITPSAGGTPQPFTAREPSYTGPISALSNDPTVATVSGSGNGPGPVTFTVTPVSAGSTTITVTGGAGHTATVAITVIGPLTANPSSLTFSGTTGTQDFTASDPFYAGALSASVDNPAIASVSPASSGPPPVTFHVTPISEGSTNVTVSDTYGETTKVSIVVSSGGLTANPTLLIFTVTGAPKTFTAAENNYTGTITATSSSPGVASVAPASAIGPTPPPYTVTPVSAGNASIAVADTHAHTKFVDVDVTGPLTPTPGSLTFNGDPATQTIRINDPNYSASISASSSDLSVATVTPTGTGPNATFTVTPVNQSGSGGSATINFSDVNGGTTSASVSVNPGPLGVSKPSLTLSGSGSRDSFTASEALYSGLINAVSTNTAVATVSPASGSGPGPVTFNVTATGPGTATINVTDNHAGAQTVNVTVSESPTVGSLATFTDVGTTQNPSVTESGYTGTFSVTNSSSCAGIVSVGPIPGTGPSTSVPVTSLSSASGGSCTFQVRDDVNGGLSAPVSVTVGPFGSVVLAPTSLSFSDVGSGSNKSFTASETNYSGTLTLDTSSCPSAVATVSPTSGVSGVTFTVTPVGSGSCTIKVNDDHTQTSSLTATVSAFGAIVPSPTSLTFTDVTPGQSFTVSESGYTGNFTIDQSACAGLATVSPLSGDSTTTFTVTPSNTTVTGGSCNVSITDDHATPSATVAITVGPFGALTPSPASLAFQTSGAAQTFTVAESNYSGNFTVDASKCSTPGIATESPGSGTASTTFTVTPGSVVGNCAIKITDDHGGLSSVTVSVTSGGLTVSPVTLTFAGPGSPSQTFTANEAGALTFNAASSDATIATVLPATQPGPGPVTFTVTPSAVNTGTATITVTDDISGSTAVVSVGVGTSPLVKKRHPILLHKPLPKPGTTPAPRGRPPVRVPITPIVRGRIIIEGGGGERPIQAPQSPSPSPSVSPTRTPTPSPIIPRPTPVPIPVPSMAPIAAALTVSASNIGLTLGAEPQTIIVSEPGYARLFTVSTSNAGVATASTTSGIGPTLGIAIVARGVGVATIRLADDRGSVRMITVVVRVAAPLHPPGKHAP